MSLYGSSKAAINLLTKAWAAEYGPSGFLVNASEPWTYAHGRDPRNRKGARATRAQAPEDRSATADEIAEAIVFLATDGASFHSHCKTCRRRRAHRHSTDCESADVITDVNHALTRKQTKRGTRWPLNQLKITA